MSDMHILIGDGKNYQVAMHFLVPPGDNSALVPWRTALVNSGLGGSTSLPDGDGAGGTIDAVEKAAVEDGSVLEHVGGFLVESNGPQPARVRVALRKFYAQTKRDTQAALQVKLKWFGATESEA